MQNRIYVLDHGFVELVEFMGGDLKTVNAARCSFGKSKEELDDSDIKLINYLADNQHYSPFRHTHFSFLLKSPEFVMRQHYKHAIGISYSEGREVDHAWNELSMRYTNMSEAKFYNPEQFRKQSKSNKQCSTDETVAFFGDGIYVEHGQPYGHGLICNEVEKHTENSIALYNAMIQAGVSKEQARMVLPLNVYTDVTWTVSLQGLANFINLRDHEHSQYEIRVYAQALRELAMQVAPVSVQALVGD